MIDKKFSCHLGEELEGELTFGKKKKKAKTLNLDEAETIKVCFLSLGSTEPFNLIQRMIHIFVFASFQEKENVEAADSDGDDFGGAAPPKAKKSAGKTVTFETDHVDGADEDDETEFVEGDGAVSTTRKFF